MDRPDLMQNSKFTEYLNRRMPNAYLHELAGCWNLNVDSVLSFVYNTHTPYSQLPPPFPPEEQGHFSITVSLYRLEDKRF